MIWAMHIQQVEIISQYASITAKERILPAIAAEGKYVVSVTSDRSAANGPMHTQYPIIPVNGGFKIERHAPTVTGAAFGDIFLVLMKAGQDTEKLTFAIVEKEQINKLEISPTWHAMGMRGTQSCGLYMEAMVPGDQIFDPENFEKCSLTVMNPLGHLLWALSWLGAVKSIYSKFLGVSRKSENRQRYNLHSDLFLHEISKIRSRLDAVESYLEHYLGYYKDAVKGIELLPDVNPFTFRIKMNNLKILASEMLSEATDALVQIAGVRYGYMKSEELPLERLYRDIRSSTLMINNHALHTINGKLSMVERY